MTNVLTADGGLTPLPIGPGTPHLNTPSIVGDSLTPLPIGPNTPYFNPPPAIGSGLMPLPIGPNTPYYNISLVITALSNLTQAMASFKTDASAFSPAADSTASTTDERSYTAFAMPTMRGWQHI